MPALPFTRLFNAWRVTPSTLAPSVTVSPNGSRQSCRTVRPGCGGLCIGMVTSPSVIIDIINVGRVAMFIEAKDDPPVCANGDAPKPGQVARQRVQVEAGQIHIVGVSRYVQLRQHTGNFGYMLRQQPPAVTALIQPL